MACPVLARARPSAAVFLLALAFLTSETSWARNQTTQCSPSNVADVPASVQKEFQELRKQVEAGPFYKELVRRFGRPQRCQLDADGEKIALSYAFRNNAHLDARTDPSIEYSEQRTQFSGLNGERALALLKKGEEDSFGRDGCGIDWKRSEDESTDERDGSRAAVFRGNSCNCQARIIYRRNTVVALVLSSSC